SGSLKNKILFLLPAALLLSAFAPWAIMPLLMIGGVFLCFEGYEKVHQMMVTDNSPRRPRMRHRPATPGSSRKRRGPPLSTPTLFSRLNSWQLAWRASHLQIFSCRHSCF